MIRNIAIATIAAMIFMGAGCQDTTTRVVQVPAEEPSQPSQPSQPVEPSAPSIPTAGVGSIKGELDCEGGTITTKYSFGNVEQDNKSFVIEYARNGATEDLVYPATTTNGSRATVNDIYYVRANDDKSTVSWIVKIYFQTPDESYALVTTTIKQPKCDDNSTAMITTYQVK